MLTHTTSRAARWLVALSLLAALGCGGDSDTASGPDDGDGDPGAGDVLPRELIGTWTRGNVSPIGFYNPSNGSWGAPSGVGVFYKFLPNGQFERGILLQTTLQHCTNSVLGYRRGTVRVNGSALELRSTTHRMKSVDNCVKANNYEKTLENMAETINVQIGTDEYGHVAMVMRSSTTGTDRYYLSRD